MGAIVKVEDDRSLQAVVLAFKLANKDLRKLINQATRDKFNAPFKAGIQDKARTRFEQKALVTGARVAAGNPPVFTAATSRRALRGGFVPDTLWYAAEFGGAHDKNTYETTSPKGKRYRVTRHTANQLPVRRRKGPIFLTIDEMGPRAASLWAQIIIKVFNDAAREGD